MNTWLMPNISIDVVPFTIVDNVVGVMLGKRLFEPFLNEFALPGVLLLQDERIDEAAYRALNVKLSTPMSRVKFLSDAGVFDNPDRDPRGATVSITKLAIVPSDIIETDRVGFYPLSYFFEKATVLPFDHKNIIQKTVSVFRNKMFVDKDFMVALFGERFTTNFALNVTRSLNMVVSNPVDVSNFSRSLKSVPTLRETDETLKSGRGRPSRVWSFN